VIGDVMEVRRILYIEETSQRARKANTKAV